MANTTTTWEEHLKRQIELAGTTQTGVIILGDISGYTGLVTQMELEHSQMIMQFLFDSIFQATDEHFLVNEIEGDAIFAYCVNPKDPEALLKETLSQMHSYGHAFYEARQDMLKRRAVDDNACACHACGNIDQLSFKFVIHYGEFAVTMMGPFVKLVGGSVILAHRLLKNDVPSDTYVLMTDAALEFLSSSERQKFTPATEEINHFGTVKIGYQLLDWKQVATARAV